MIFALYDIDADIRMNSYNMLKTEITTSTTSMTSIPRPLKFIIPHFQAIKEAHDKYPSNDKFKLLLSDLLAILVIVTPNVTETSLSYVLSGTKNDITSWGQEFIK
jgi:26S proteasome regulatory subunit N1